MNRHQRETLGIGLAVLLAAAIPPNLFPAAQAGLAKLSTLGTRLLLPSVALLMLSFAASVARGHTVLSRRIWAGALSGLVATLGLELVRATSFHLGGMPGDMPRLLGVLLTDRFMLGPSTLSDVLGYAYHFWNGISFGIIFAVILGRKPLWWALSFAQLIGIGFLLSPAVSALGIGFMGLSMPAMPVTVVTAHLVYGLLLGLMTRWLIPPRPWLFGRANVTATEARTP